MMIELTGITPNSPFNFMAALGLMRLLTEDQKQTQVTLEWRGCAILHGIQRQNLMQCLLKQMQDRSRSPEWLWTDSPRKKTLTEFQSVLRRLESQGDKRALSFLAAWGCDAVLNKEGFVATSRLDLTSGQQRLIKNLANLAKDLGQSVETCKAAFERSLFSQEYDEGQSAFGWDPATIRHHATEALAPTEQKRWARKGAVWLVAEAFPLHPIVPIGQAAVSIGTFHDTHRLYYYWPIWRNFALSFDEIKLLRTLSFKNLKSQIGIHEIWASEIGASGKYGALLPAKRVL